MSFLELNLSPTRYPSLPPSKIPLPSSRNVLPDELSDCLRLDEIPSFHSLCENIDKTKTICQSSVIHYSIGKTLVGTPLFLQNIQEAL